MQFHIGSLTHEALVIFIFCPLFDIESNVFIYL